MIRLAGEESRGMTHLASLGRRVSGFFTGLGGAGALAVLGDPHSGDRGYSNKPLTLRIYGCGTVVVF